MNFAGSAFLHPKTPREQLARFWMAAALLLLAGHALSLWMGQGSAASLRIAGTLLPGQALLAAGALLLAAFSSPAGPRKFDSAWLLMGIAYFLQFLGNGVWFYYRTTGQPPPYPSAVDLFLLLAYPVLLLGILRLPHQRISPVEVLKTQLGVGIVMLSSGLLVWNYLIGPQLRRMPTESPLAHWVSLAYPVFGFLLLWAVSNFLIRRDTRALRGTVLLLSAGLALEIGANFWSSWLLLQNKTAGSWVGFLYNPALFLIGLAGVTRAFYHQAAPKAGQMEPDPSLPVKPSFISTFFPYLWVIPAYILLVHYDEVPILNYRLLVAVVGMIVLLVIIRQMVTLIDNQRIFHKLQQSEAEKADLQRSAYFQAMIQNLSDMISVVDKTGRITYVTQSVERVCGYRPADLIGTRAIDLIHPEDQERALAGFRQYFQASMENAAPFSPIRYRYRHKNGTWRVIESLGNNRLEDPIIQGLVINSHDITAWVQAEEEKQAAYASLRLSEERYALASRGANDGLWDWNVAADALYFSPRWCEMLGYSPEEAPACLAQWVQMIHPADGSGFQAELRKHLDGETSHFEFEHRILRSDGSYHWVLTRGAAVRGPAGQAERMAGSQTDIANRKQIEMQLLHDAFHDALTGLPNRALFVDRLAHALQRGSRRDNFTTVLCLDIDLFRVINDSLGHSVGDLALIHLADRLRGAVRSVDTVARQGGDEFLVLLEELAGPEDALAIAERILEDLRQPILLEGHPIYLTGSIGVTNIYDNNQSPADILRDADIAMNRAKSQGRAQAVVFDPLMRTDAYDRLLMESDLREALEQQQFVLHYQPLHSLADGHLIGFEALIRWVHPKKGMIPPARFIPVAEETGLIQSIGWWALNEACHQIKSWQELAPTDPPLTINVNLSTRQLVSGTLVQQVFAVLSHTRLDPRYLKLEITETELMENLSAAMAIIQELRELGVQIHIDDFGTGYSSLSYIQDFPVDAIKIDKSFIDRIELPGNQNELLRSILRMAKDLGLHAIAEGIETEGQLRHLQVAGCPVGQGYLFSRPLDSLAATRYLERCLTEAHA